MTNKTVIFMVTTVTIANPIQCYVPMPNAYTIYICSVLGTGSKPDIFTLLGCYIVLDGR